MMEEGMGGQGGVGDFVGFFTDNLLEVFAVAGGQGEELLDEEKVEELLLDFGVHENFIRHIRDQSS